MPDSRDHLPHSGDFVNSIHVVINSLLSKFELIMEVDNFFLPQGSEFSEDYVLEPTAYMF